MTRCCTLSNTNVWAVNFMSSGSNCKPYDHVYWGAQTVYRQLMTTDVYLLYICCIIKNYWNWYIAQCFMFVIHQKCIVTILLLTDLCTVMTLGKAMICIFIISRNQLAKELFSKLEVFCGTLYHQFLRNACLKII